MEEKGKDLDEIVGRIRDFEITDTIEYNNLLIKSFRLGEKFYRRMATLENITEKDREYYKLGCRHNQEQLNLHVQIAKYFFRTIDIVPGTTEMLDRHHKEDEEFEKKWNKKKEG